MDRIPTLRYGVYYTYLVKTKITTGGIWHPYNICNFARACRCDPRYTWGPLQRSDVAVAKGGRVVVVVVGGRGSGVVGPTSRVKSQNIVRRSGDTLPYLRVRPQWNSDLRSPCDNYHNVMTHGNTAWLDIWLPMTRKRQGRNKKIFL